MTNLPDQIGTLADFLASTDRKARERNLLAAAHAVNALQVSLATDDSDNPFHHTLDRWCGGRPDEQTLELIN